MQHYFMTLFALVTSDCFEVSRAEHLWIIFLYAHRAGGFNQFSSTQRSFEIIWKEMCFAPKLILWVVLLSFDDKTYWGICMIVVELSGRKLILCRSQEQRFESGNPKKGTWKQISIWSTKHWWRRRINHEFNVRGASLPARRLQLALPNTHYHRHYWLGDSPKKQSSSWRAATLKFNSSGVWDKTVCQISSLYCWSLTLLDFQACWATAYTNISVMYQI